MLRSKRNQGRNGHVGCFCCYPTDSASIIRTREEAAWRAEAMSDLYATMNETDEGATIDY